MTLPQCGVGCHFLTRMLAAPTVQAYDAGIVTPANCYYDMLLYHSKQAFEQFRIDPTRIDTKLNYANGMTNAVPRQVIDAHVLAITCYVA